MADPTSNVPAPRRPQRAASDSPPDGGPAPAAPTPPADSAHDAPRTPDEYLETPGSHRREDGAATDVGG